tara:strand:- start:3317 stop:5353 length:2037 start_codon:yes stop_codon:yes gene_type:complete
MADIGERLGGDNIEFTVDKPLRIIIGGPPHSGKSTFMNLLEDRFRYYQIPVELLDLDLSAPTPLKTGFTQQREKKKWTSTLAEEAREMFEGAEGVQVVLGDSVGLISDINEIISQPADVAILLVSGGHGDYDTTYRKVVRKWKEYYEDIRTPLLVVLRSTMNPADESMFDPQDNYGVVVGMDRDAYEDNTISGHYKYDGIYPTNACLEGVVFEIAQSFDLKVRSATDPEHLDLLNQKWPDLKDKKTWTPPEGSMLGGIERAYFEERGRVPADQRAESFGAETITTTKIDNNGGEWTLQYRQPPIGEQPTEIVATTPTWSHEKNDFSNVFTLYLKRVPDSTSIMPSRQSPTGYWWTASSKGWGEKNIRFTNYDSLWNWIGSDEIYDFPYFAESFGAEDDLSFKEWADQETMTHGQQEPFDDWLNDELSSHGDNITLQDWGQHELDSHYERYGAEGDPKVRRLKTIAKWINDNHGDTHFADIRDTQYGYYNAFNQYITKDGKKLVVYELTPKGEYPRREVFSHNPLEPYRKNKEVESWVKSTFTSPVTLRHGAESFAAEGMTSFEVINIEYSNSEGTASPSDYYDLPDELAVSVEETDVSATEDRIREKIESYIFRSFGEDIKVVDLTAFYTGTTDPLRGNYEDYAAEGKIHSQLMIGSLIGLGAGLWAVNRFKESREER